MKKRVDPMSDEADSRLEHTLRAFKWSVRALAQEADVQASLFPGQVWIGDELVLEFDEHRSKLAEEGLSAHFAPAEVERIEALDRLFQEMTDANDLSLWQTEEALVSPPWNEVRRAARELLEEVGWPTSPPPQERAIYVVPNA
ncbi:MAG TPA: hypothetical protein VEU33_52145 [Archangium sp.]|nr:hypothetical protein [Archangium sp.]